MSKEIGKIEAELKDVERRLNEQKERIDKYLGFPIYGEEPRKWKFQGVPCSESSVHFIDYMMQWAYHVGKSGMHMGTVNLDGNDMYIEHISHRDMSHLNGCDPMCPKCGLTLLLVDKPDSPIILCSSCDYRETEEEWLKEQEKK